MRALCSTEKQNHRVAATGKNKNYTSNIKCWDVRRYSQLQNFYTLFLHMLSEYAIFFSIKATAVWLKYASPFLGTWNVTNIYLFRWPLSRCKILSP